MTDNENAVFRLAQSIRFSGDHLVSGSVSEVNNRNLLAKAAHEGLRVSKELTPHLQQVIDLVFERCCVDPRKIEVFVFNASEIQASCASLGKDGALISLSSQLVNILPDEELKFVVGHELGHFALRHCGCIHSTDESPAGLILSRAREISADRMGLLACGEVNEAVKAIVKCISGLNSEKLRLDVSAFLDQIRGEASEAAVRLSKSTHPSFLVRCRALLWFSMSETYRAHLGLEGGRPLSEVDNYIVKDLDKFGDAVSRQPIDEAVANFKMWLFFAYATSSGKLSKHDRAKLVELFGEEMVVKLKNLIDGYNPSGIAKIIEQKLSDSMVTLQRFSPLNAAEEIQTQQAEAEAVFNRTIKPQLI